MSTAPVRPRTSPIVTSQNGSRQRCTPVASRCQVKCTTRKVAVQRRQRICRKKLTCRKSPTYISAVATADHVFHALANPVRRELLEILTRRPLSAGGLSAQFELSRPPVAEHLKGLRA